MYIYIYIHILVVYSFSWWGNILLYLSLIIHSPFEGQVDCFPLLAILNKAAMDILYKVLVDRCSHLTWINNKSGISDRVMSVLIFKENVKFFSKVVVPFYVPTTWEYSCSISPPAFGVVDYIYFSHCGGYNIEVYISKSQLENTFCISLWIEFAFP